MTIERTIAYMFQMDAATWLRHANPWSVILRNTALPIFIAAFWSRLWLGWWASLPVAFAFLWIWLNPRIFPAPQSLDHWTSKGVLGERVWLNRDTMPIPAYHRKVPNILSAISAISMLFVLYGIVMFDLWPTLFGVMLVYMSKLWFFDRMVWLWNDMKDATPEYICWQNPHQSISQLSLNPGEEKIKS